MHRILCVWHETHRIVLVLFDDEPLCVMCPCPMCGIIDVLHISSRHAAGGECPLGCLLIVFSSFVIKHHPSQ